MKQAAIEFNPPLERPMEFAGPGYVPEIDKKRLTGHCYVVLNWLRERRGAWYTYEALAHWTCIPAGSIRTRVSNLKAAGHNIETRTRPDRFREVRLV